MEKLMKMRRNLFCALSAAVPVGIYGLAALFLGHLKLGGVMEIVTALILAYALLQDSRIKRHFEMIKIEEDKAS